MKTADDTAFESLVKRYRDPLGAAAYHLCGDRDGAQDIVQETLIDAYKGLAALRDPGSAGAWLYAILRRKAATYRLVRNAETQLLDEPAAPGPEDGEALVRGIVMERMGGLTAEDREVLAGKYLLGLSYREIATTLGITENAVGVRCFRAMERLREALRGVGMDVPDRRSWSGIKPQSE
jgi:RNA polymerase sigma-70 factor (ECF subfamily)